MSLESNVAVVALVVSLVALFVALIQLLAALVGTADGYRKCMPATLSSWSALRRRTFIWAELRFEVRFMTPHIAIIPASEAEREQQETFVGPAWFLTRSKGRSRSQKSSLRDELKRRITVLGVNVLMLLGLRVMPDVSQMERALHKSLHSTEEKTSRLHEDSSKSKPDALPSDDALEKQVRRSVFKSARSQKSPQRNALAPNRELLVSWLRLLQSLDETYELLTSDVDQLIGVDLMEEVMDMKTQQSWDNFEHRKARMATNVTLHVDKVTEARRVENKLVTGASLSKSVHTHVVVAMRYWTWDSMPPDLSKPLATSTLNNIILMGLRLNMQWRKLDLENSLFVADGNGYSLSSFEIRGMGTGFRFAKIGHTNVNRQCVPSEAVDKMMFGIIPGVDNPMVRRDYAMVSNGGIDFDGFLARLGFKDVDLRKELIRNFDEPLNELMTLLCPFLPLQTSNTFCNLFPAWLGWATSCFHFWEGRIALMQKLRRRAEDLTKGRIYQATVKHVLIEFEKLEQEYDADFYNRWRPMEYDGVVLETSRLEGESDELRKGLIDKLRSIHDWTSRYFNGYEETDYDWSEAGETARTCYVDLVSAHATMSYHAVDAAIAVSNVRRNEFPDIDDLKRHLGASLATRGFASHQFALAEEYVERITDHKHSLVSFYRQRRWARSDEEIEAAWWVLMLRGIVWDMSTQGSPGAAGRAPRWDGPAVSSALYNVETPVWII